MSILFADLRSDGIDTSVMDSFNVACTASLCLCLISKVPKVLRCLPMSQLVLSLQAFLPNPRMSF